MSSVVPFMARQTFGLDDVRPYECDPEDAANIHPAGVWRDRVVEHFEQPQELRGDPLPWSKCAEHFRLRSGELTVWAGPNGCGKSLLLGQIALDLAIRSDRSVVIASLEMPPVTTLSRMARQAVERIEPTAADVDGFLRALGSRLWLFDQTGSVTPSRIFGVVRFAREQIGADHVFVDSLMKLGIPGDDYVGQARLVDRLATYCRDSGLHLHLVAHNRKGAGEDSRDGRYSIRGAGEISDLVDNVALVWRNKAKERAEQNGDIDADLAAQPDASITLDKQRHQSWEGAVALWFSRGTMQYVGRPGTDTIPYMKFAEQAGGLAR